MIIKIKLNFSVNFLEKIQKMPKKVKQNISISKNPTDWDSCAICGYTLTNFKDVKLQKKLVRLHMTKEHDVAEFVETAPVIIHYFADKNETASSTIQKVIKNNQPQFI